MSGRAPPALDFVIVGATGDLARRKLLPALYNLHLDGFLPQDARIIGYSRRDLTDAAFRARSEEAVREFSRRDVDPAAWDRFAARLGFVCARLGGLDEVAQRTRPGRIVHLSTPPSAFSSTVQGLAQHDLVRDTRLVIEKPFGRDRLSARELNRTVHEFFDESQVFRVDHYLGKESVQNLLVLRFGNSMFERVWDRDAIDHVQITMAESIGVESRGEFYEEVGALRDVIQNHTLQVLTLLTMEPPRSFEPEAIRDEKVKLLHAVRPVEAAAVVRGQYARGAVNGDDVPGYREEEGVDPDSATETYTAIRLEIDNWRWAGVPFYLRTGKRLAGRTVEVYVSFRPAPVRFFQQSEVEDLESNHLLIRIQPQEGISLGFLAKEPGPTLRVQPVEMDFSYDRSFEAQPPEAYERLFHAAMGGEHTLFARADEVDLAWSVVQPVLDAPPPIRFYPAGTWGPSQADALIAPRRWRLR